MHTIYGVSVRGHTLCFNCRYLFTGSNALEGVGRGKVKDIQMKTVTTISVSQQAVAQDRFHTECHMDRSLKVCFLLEWNSVARLTMNVSEEHIASSFKVDKRGEFQSS